MNELPNLQEVAIMAENLYFSMNNLSSLAHLASEGLGLGSQEQQAMESLSNQISHIGEEARILYEELYYLNRSVKAA